MDTSPENPFVHMVRERRWRRWTKRLESVGKYGFLIFASAAMVTWIGEDNGTMSTGTFERDMLVTGGGVALSIGSLLVANWTHNLAADSAAIVQAHNHPELGTTSLDSES